MKLSFKTAMAAYVALAIVAGLALDGKLRIALWILLGGLAIKTCIAHFAGW